MELLLAIPILIALFGLVLILSAIPLYFALKMVGVHEGLGKALIVNLIAGGITLVAALAVNLLLFFIPILPQVLSFILPFAVLTLVVMQAYGLEIVQAAIVSVIQYVVSFILVFGLVMAAITLGFGGALLAGIAGA